MSSKTLSLFLGICACLMNVSWFMSYPILPIYLNVELGLSFAAVGGILATVSLTGRVLPVFGGYIADRTSQVHCLVIGIVLRAVGYAGLAFVHDVYDLVLPLALNSLGLALFDPSIRALISQLPEQDRVEGFARLNLFLNAGVIAGPLVGALLTGVDARYPFFVAGVSLGALALSGGFVWRSLRALGQIKHSHWGFWSFIEPLRNPAFRRFVFSIILAAALLCQIQYMLPLYGYLLAASFKSMNMSSVYIVNGATGLGVMLLLKKHIGKYPPLLLLALGIALVGISLMAIPLIASSYWLLLCIVVFTVGETLVLPLQEIQTSRLAPRAQLGQYFGLSEMCWGLGATAATAAGPKLAEIGMRSSPPWLALGLIAAFLSALYVSWYRADTKHHVESSTSEVKS
jgi:MFS family permease